MDRHRSPCEQFKKPTDDRGLKELITFFDVANAVIAIE